jgi:HPt (histidine-containing phosphotransfer) domain-containing protein
MPYYAYVAAAGALAAALALGFLPGVRRRPAPAVRPSARRRPAAFDPATYRELFAEAPSEGRAWLEAYLATASRLVGDIGRQAGGEDRPGLAASAHELASSSAWVGAPDLAAISRSLETAAPGAAGAELHRLAALLAAAFAQVQDEIVAFLAAMVPA